MIKEVHTTFKAVREGLAPTEVRKAILEGELIAKPTFHTRRMVANCIVHRYLWEGSDWCAESLAQATAHGPNTPQFLSLAYLYYALRDRLTFEFVTGPVWERWRNRSTALTQADLLSFLEKKSEEEPHIRKWRESTRKKVAQSTIVALRDFGLLHGKHNKQIQKPSIAPETVFHLLCILVAEGLEGRSVIEAPDWRLFLWSESEVAQALGELSQKQWIRFESSGRTVMLELLRQPEVIP